MIFAKPTKYGAGVEIHGDFHDFESLRETIYYLTNSSPLDDGRGEFVLGLASEVRHAIQGDREILKLQADIACMETNTYYGFRALWPNFLLQCGLLRWAAGFQPTKRDHQSNLYRLEACVEHALNSYDPFIGRRCLEWLSTFQGLSEKYLLQFVPNCSLRYVTVGKAGKARFKQLPDVLRMLSPYSKEYREFEDHMESVAKQKGCSPEDLHDLGEWPEIKW